MAEKNQFDVSGRVAVVTGGSGVLGGSIAESLLSAGAKVVIIGRTPRNVEDKTRKLKMISSDVIGITCNVLHVDEIEKARDAILRKWHRVDILVNCAGGNIPGATLDGKQSFFEMESEAWNAVLDLNMNGTVYPSFVFGEVMARQKEGSIINISSMAAINAITRVPGYSAAKAGIDNFTRWLATEMALKYSDRVRVNAIAPGFFIGNQNRNVLLNADGSLTERSEKVLAKTPMGRFGDISELNGAVQFLCSDAASFITGAVLPIDGGFSAFSGV